MKGLKPVDFKAVAAQGNYVYCYLRADGSPYYVGIASNAWRPRVKHRTNRGGVQVPANRIRIRVLRSGLTRDKACEWERFYIARYGRKDLGTGILRNRTDGGDNGAPGMRHSEAWKQRMSKLRSGRPLSEKTRAKLRKNAKRPEHIARMAANCFTKEARAKIGDALRGRTRDAKTCRNISEGKVKYAEACGFTTEEWLAMDDAQHRAIKVRIAAGWTDRDVLLLPAYIRLDVLQTATLFEMDPIEYSALGKAKQTDVRKRFNNWRESGEPKGVSWRTWRGLERAQCNAIARCASAIWVDYGVSLETYLSWDKKIKNRVQARYKQGKRGAELLAGIAA